MSRRGSTACSTGRVGSSAARGMPSALRKRQPSRSACTSCEADSVVGMSGQFLLRRRSRSPGCLAALQFSWTSVDGEWRGNADRHEPKTAAKAPKESHLSGSRHQREPRTTPQVLKGLTQIRPAKPSRPNQALQQTAAAMPVPREFKAFSAAAAAGLGRPWRKPRSLGFVRRHPFRGQRAYRPQVKMIRLLPKEDPIADLQLGLIQTITEDMFTRRTMVLTNMRLWLFKKRLFSNTTSVVFLKDMTSIRFRRAACIWTAWLSVPTGVGSFPVTGTAR
jgi:hypothetical protein